MRSLILTLTLICVQLIANGQAYHPTLKALVNQPQLSPEKRIKTLNRFLDTINQSNLRDRAYGSYLLGDIYLGKDNIDSSHHFFDKALVLARQASDRKIQAQSLVELGRINLMIQDFKTAQTLLSQGQALAEQLKDDPLIALSSRLLGAMFYLQHNYYKALDYTESALAAFDRAGVSPLLSARINTLQTLGVIHAELENQRAAAYYLHETLKANQEAGNANNALKAALDLGFLYYEYEKPDSALYFAQVIEDQVPANDYHSLAEVNTIRHGVYRLQKAYPKALEFAQKSLNYHLKAPSPNPYLAYSYFYVAWSHQLLRQYDSALVYLQKALINNHKNFVDSNIYSFPPLTDIVSLDYQTLFLEHKGECFHQRYQQNKQLKDLEHSLQSYQQAIALIDTLRYSYDNPQTLMLHNRISASIFTKAIHCLHDLYQQKKEVEYLQLIFDYTEKNRAFLLSRLLAQQQQLQTSSNSTVNTYLQAQEEINEIDNELKKENIPNKDSLKTTLFETKKRKDSLLEVLKTQNPAYYQQYFHTNPVALANVQQQLPPNAALIVYSVQDQGVTMLKISSSDIQSYYQATEQPLDDLVEEFRTAILDKKDQPYVELGYSLHQLLIAPLTLSNNIEQLYILPDQSLHYLPFDALLTQQATNTKLPNYNKLAYLLKKYKLSYVFSATTWQQQRQLPASMQQKLLAYAPTFGDGPLVLARQPGERRNKVLGNLKGAQAEVERIKSFFPSQIYKGEQVTKDLFLETAGQASIIHLATHAILNQSDGAFSGIAFAREEQKQPLLYAYELYGLDLNADLVVLSACNTALGEWQAGEGVMSLARGFTSAGCKSLIMSLWEVADQSAPNIMPTFYESLAQGKDKSAALQDAKLAYIQRADANGAHPYYWAGLSLMGDANPLETPTSNAFWWVIVAAIAVLGLLWVLWLRSKGR